MIKVVASVLLLVGYMLIKNAAFACSWEFQISNISCLFAEEEHCHCGLQMPQLSCVWCTEKDKTPLATIRISLSDGNDLFSCSFARAHSTSHCPSGTW
jgi:hypothetical protein